MLFAMLALTVVVAAAATGPARPLPGVEGSFPASHTWPPPAASNSTLLLPGRALAITAGADACTGTSAGLPAAECSAWLDMYDGTGGPSWAHCSSNRLDPCSCGGLACTDGHITGLDLGSNNMQGTVPVTLSAMTKLTILQLANNKLEGLLPALQFTQYTAYCCLQYDGSNHFACPLPPGADKCNSCGTSITCTPPPPTPVPTPISTPAPTPVMYSCDTTSGQCKLDPKGPLSPVDCIATCKSSPTPAPTLVMYSCNTTAGQCAPDPEGSLSAGECIATCKCVVPHNCGQLNGTTRTVQQPHQRLQRVRQVLQAVDYGAGLL